MHFKTATSIAVLACAASAFARPDNARPYKPAARQMLRSLPNMSMMRRDTMINGYQPEQSQCHDGATCSEACGANYTSCPSNDNLSHCYNPAANEQCCPDGSGNSCEASYYCTHDHNLKTWCCPNTMNLDECAKAFNVDGALESTAPEPTNASSSSSAPASKPTSATHSATQAPPTSATTSAPASSTSAVSSNTAASSSSTEAAEPQNTVSDVEDQTSAAFLPTNIDAVTPIWPGANNTLPVLAAQPTGNLPPVPPVGSGKPTPSPLVTVSRAATSGLNVLLLLAAGVVALL